MIEIIDKHGVVRNETDLAITDTRGINAWLQTTYGEAFVLAEGNKVMKALTLPFEDTGARIREKKAEEDRAPKRLIEIEVERDQQQRLRNSEADQHYLRGY